VNMSFGGGAYNWTQIGGGVDAPGWAKLGSITVANAGDTASVRLRIWQAYAIFLDRFYITDNTLYTPKDADFGLGSTEPADPGTVVLKTTNGVLTVEAEDTAYDKTRMWLRTDAIFSGGKAIGPIAEDKTSPLPIDAPPDIDLSFIADQAGTYNVWVRSTSSLPDTYGRACNMSFGGGSYNWTQIGGGVNAPGWAKLGSITVANAGGVASVRLRNWQSYDIFYDKFVITNNASYIPNDGTPGSDLDTTVGTMKTLNGFVMEECEYLPWNPNALHLVTGSDMSNNQGLAVNFEDKTVPAADTAPDLNLSFTADKSGTYAVWVRLTCTPAGSTGNSVFLSVGGAPYDYAALSGNPTTFDWSRIASVTAIAGDYVSVRIIKRQNIGIVFDKVWISDTKVTPTGMGKQPAGGEVVLLPSGVYPIPPVTPPAEHPRLMFRASDIPNIKANFAAEQNQPAIRAFQALIAKPTDGVLPAPQPGASNFNQAPLTNIEALAFDYAVNGSVGHGQAAVQAIKNYYNTVQFLTSDSMTYRYIGAFIFTASEVYDWCYPLMNGDDRKEFMHMAESVAVDMEIGYPPNKQGAVTGHGGETSLLRDLMSLGIASYDERPDVYNYVAGRFFAQYVEPRNYEYRSSLHNQGNAYGEFRGGSELWAAFLFRQMSGVYVFDEDQQYFPYQWMYSRRPDGQAFRVGDDYWESGTTPYWNGWNATLGMVSNFYGDEYLKREFERENPFLMNFTNSLDLYTPVTHLIINDPLLAGKPSAELPLSRYFPGPAGTMIARTGWNDGVEAPDVVAMMNIGVQYAANHQHLDMGSFQIYYKGMLTGHSGRYDDGYATSHDAQYNKRGIANNILLIHDPNETFNYQGTPMANDGGYRIPNNGGEVATFQQWMSSGMDTGAVLGEEFGPDTISPEYTYIKGDITRSYSSKAQEVLRSMLFLPLDDKDHPAAMIVMDKVTASDPRFKKGFLLHSLEEPTVTGNRTVIERTALNDTNKNYNGRLVCDTLLPKPGNTVIEKIGGPGKEFWIDGQNYPAKFPPNSSSDNEGQGWGRVEISPVAPQATDYFLNVLTVSDAGGVVKDLDSQLIEGEAFVGAVVSDRVAVFAKGAQRLEGPISFTIPGTGDFEVAVAGIKEGTWTVNGMDVKVSDEGGIAYFSAAAGGVTMTYKNTDSGKTFTTTPVTSDGVGVKLDKAYIYLDPAAALADGAVMVPAAALAKKLGASASWDAASRTLTVEKMDENGKVNVIKITAGSLTAYVNGQPAALAAAPAMNGETLTAPADFLTESLGGLYSWDPFAMTANLTSPKPAAPKGLQGYAIITGSSASAYSEDYTDKNSWDKNYDTLWSAQGEEYVTYEFDSVYNITGVELFLNPNSGRTAYFEILASEDGVNFTSVYSGQGDGAVNNAWETFAFGQPVRAKFMRYLAKGSNISMWNGLKEIRFKTNDFAIIENSSASAYSEQFYDTNAWDGDFNTLWSAQGEEYVTFRFDREYTVGAVDLFLNPNSGRTAYFEILASEDGVNFTSVYSGQGDGSINNAWETFAFGQPVKATYMRYLAKGSNISMWNGLKEIRFRVAAEAAVDKDALAGAIAKAEAYDANRYTVASWAALSEALGKAREAYQSSDGQAAIDAAAEALYAAMDALVPAKLECPVKSMAAKIGKPLAIPYTWDGPGAPVITSSNQAVCGIGANGTLTPMKAGIAVITITAPDGTKVVFAVTVTA
ncbi:MAG: discoidin domain-containing protein, partial [Firmicutes bacterium]|nr:discoidin domain-containing protein [Bacillota bacterium]